MADPGWIPEISDSEIKRLLKHIQPLVRGDKGLCTVGACDPRKQSYPWVETEVEPVDESKLMVLTKIKTFHVQLFAYDLDTLRATEDGDGTLLDNVMIIFGAGMSDSNQHAPTDLPITLAGGGAGQLKGGRHVKYPVPTPLANLNLSLLDKLGVPTIESIGDSTGRLEYLTDI